MTGPHCAPVTKRINSSLLRREEVLGTEEDVRWEDELASSTGVLDAAQIRSIAERFDESVGEPLGSVSKWIEWGLDWLEEAPARLSMIVRPLTVVSVLGKSIEGFDSDSSKASQAIKE